MKRRFYSSIKVSLILFIDFILLYYFFGIKIGTMIIFGVIFYVFFLGESLSLLKMSAIPQSKLDAREQSCLESGISHLMQRYIDYTGKKKNHIKVLVIPDDNFNAYTYGWRYIAITAGALRSLNNLQLEAMLSHELGHIIALDVVIKRLLIVNLMVAFLIWIIVQMIWIIIGVIICILITWLINNLAGFLIASKLMKGIQQLSRGLSSVILTILQMITALIERHREYKADEFAVELGYGRELIFVLERFVGEIQPAQNILDVIYATHPKTKKRICKLEQKINRKMMKAKSIKIK